MTLVLHGTKTQPWHVKNAGGKRVYGEETARTVTTPTTSTTETITTTTTTTTITTTEPETSTMAVSVTWL